jgi:hypothetical protein
MVPFFLTAPGAAAAHRLRERSSVTVRLSSRLDVAVAPTPAARACLGLIDGARPLGEIWRAAAGVLGQDEATITAAAAADFEQFNAFNWVCLRHRSVPPLPTPAFGYRGDAVVVVD